jgi:Ca2+/H+ antiporter
MRRKTKQNKTVSESAMEDSTSPCLASCELCGFLLFLFVLLFHIPSLPRLFPPPHSRNMPRWSVAAAAVLLVATVLAVVAVHARPAVSPPPPPLSWADPLIGTGGYGYGYVF